MKLLIEIPPHIYKHALEGSEDSNDEFSAIRAIANGTPINDGGICDLCKIQNSDMLAICFHCCAELKE